MTASEINDILWIFIKLFIAPIWFIWISLMLIAIIKRISMIEEILWIGKGKQHANRKDVSAENK